MTRDDSGPASPRQEGALPWDELLTGREVGDFVIREQIDEGAFGVIYRAEQKTLSREVVIKALRWRGSEEDENTRRFLREARLASRLDHPYAAHVYAFGAEPDGLLWIAMELVRGTPLDVLLATQGALSLPRFVPLFEMICQVVYTAHEQGMVHRDLKPSNVMILARAGQLLPKLLDFGIARSAAPSAVISGARRADDASPVRAAASGAVAFVGQESGAIRVATPVDPSKLTLTGNEGFMGSPPYMAPEQWASASQSDARTDQYALGVMAFEAISGRRPFVGSNPTTLAMAHVYNPVPRLKGPFSAKLNDAIARAMAKEPGDRYDNVLDLAEAFRAAAGLDSKPEPAPRLEPTLRDAMLARGPQPLADSVALLEVARSSQLAVQAALQVVRVATRMAGLLAVAAACRTVAGPSEQPEWIRDALRRLHRDELTTIEWLELTHVLVQPFVDKPDAHPIPELVVRFAEISQGDGENTSPIQLLVGELMAMESLGGREPGAHSLDQDASSALDRLLPSVSRLLDDLSFLSIYPLVARSGDRVEVWMGAQRGTRAPATVRGAGELNDGDVALTAPDGEIILILSPFCQILAPAPGTPDEMFLFDGPSRLGAKLVAFPVGFERHDDEFWTWYEANVVDLQLDADDEDEADRGARAPYMGLSAFSPEDADNYFGREREVEACVNRLRVLPLLPVVGPSGAGKSSFVQAGIIPALSAEWQTLTIRPGPSPIAELTSRLERRGFQPGNLRARLANDGGALGKILATHAARSNKHVLLVVDQFEELLTLCLDVEERRLFSAALVQACPDRDVPVRVIITLRDDFLVRAQQLPALRERLGHSLQLLGTPPPDELERIIVEPARRMGYAFEDDAMAGEMVKEVADEPGALALLSFTAFKLWETRDRKRHILPRSAYEAMGGVGGALAQHAEETLAGMTPEQKGLVREVFRQLVTADGTRAVLTRNELDQILGGDHKAEGVLEALIHARLLVASEGENNEDRVEVVHEALLSSWPRLVRWQREDAESARLRDQLRAAARQWVDRDRARGLLWRGDVLLEYRVWRGRYQGALTEAEEAFAHASLRDDARGRRIRRALLVTAFAVLAVGMLVVLQLNRTAREERERAEMSEAAAKQTTLELYQEQGRQAWLAGDALRAFAYLLEARKGGADNAPLRFLIGRVSEALDDQLLVLDAHEANVYAGQFSPDGSRLATASGDKTAKIWDALDGGLLATLEGHEASVWSLEFSPDGSQIATASWDGTAKVWNAKTSELEWTAPHEREVYWAGFTRDGSQVATVGFDESAKFWDARTGRLLHTVTSHPGGIVTATFGPHGRYFVTGGMDQVVRVWDAATHELLHHDTDHGAPVTALDVNPQGTLVASGSQTGNARIIPIHGGDARPLAGHTKVIWRIKFSPDGQRIVTASADRTAKIWDAATGELVVALEGHTGSVLSAEFNPAGTRIATTSQDGTAKLWDVQTGLLVWTFLGHTDALFPAAFDATGKRLFTGSSNGSARVWRADRTIHDLTLPIRSHCASFSPDDELIAAALQNGSIQVWNRSGQLINEFVVESSLPANYFPHVRWSPDGRNLIVTVGSQAAVWSIQANKVVARYGDHDGQTNYATYSPDGSTIVTAGNDGTAKLWKPDQPGPIMTLRGHEATVKFAAFDPTGSRLVTASYDRTARIWDTATGKLVRTLPKQKRQLVSARFSHDGKYIITSGWDKSAAIWTFDGEPLTLLEGHSSGINSALLSIDNKLAATVSDDGLVKIWDAESGRTLWSITTEGTVLTQSLELSGDGQLLLGATGKTVRVWRLTPDNRTGEQLERFARCRVPYELDSGSTSRREHDHASCR